MTKINQYWIGFQKGVREFGYSLATLINSILLSFVYVLGVGLTHVVAKLKGKHFLETGPTDKETYWMDLGLHKRPLEDYYRQF